MLVGGGGLKFFPRCHNTQTRPCSVMWTMLGCFCICLFLCLSYIKFKWIRNSGKVAEGSQQPPLTMATWPENTIYAGNNTGCFKVWVTTFNSLIRVRSLTPSQVVLLKSPDVKMLGSINITVEFHLYRQCDGVRSNDQVRRTTLLLQRYPVYSRSGKHSQLGGVDKGGGSDWGQCWDCTSSRHSHHQHAAQPNRGLWLLQGEQYCYNISLLTVIEYFIFHDKSKECEGLLSECSYILLLVVLYDT